MRTSWDFNDGLQGWIFTADDATKTGDGASQRLNIYSSSGTFVNAYWRHLTPGLVAVTGATFQGTAFHNGNNFMKMRITYTDLTSNVTTETGTGSWPRVISVTVTAGNNGKEVLRISWEGEPVRNTGHWFDNASITGFIVPVSVNSGPVIQVI